MLENTYNIHPQRQLLHVPNSKSIAVETLIASWILSHIPEPSQIFPGGPVGGGILSASREQSKQTEKAKLVLT